MKTQVLAGSHQGIYVIRLSGDVRVPEAMALERFAKPIFADAGFQGLLIDATLAESLDSTTLGVLARCALEVQRLCGVSATLICPNQGLRRLLLNMGFDEVFELIDEASHLDVPVQPIPAGMASDEREACMSVLAAHRVLMELNASNEAAFKDLVAALAAEVNDVA